MVVQRLKFRCASPLVVMLLNIIVNTNSAPAVSWYFDSRYLSFMVRFHGFVRHWWASAIDLNDYMFGSFSSSYLFYVGFHIDHSHFLIFYRLQFIFKVVLPSASLKTEWYSTYKRDR